MKAGLLGIVLVIGAALAAPMAHAHAVGWSIVPEDKAVVLHFTYAGGDPIAFAEVTVTASDGKVYQRGRADRAGKFAVVVPATAGDGLWTADVVDGEGHTLTARFGTNSAAQVVAVRNVVGQVMGILALVLLMLSVVLATQLWAMRADKRRKTEAG